MRPAGYQQVYDETAALLDWGFAAAGKVTPVGRLADLPPTPAGPTEPPQAVPVEQQDQAAPPAPAAGGVGWPGWLAAGLCAAAVVGAVHWVRRRPTR